MSIPRRTPRAKACYLSPQRLAPVVLAWAPSPKEVAGSRMHYEEGGGRPVRGGANKEKGGRAILVVFPVHLTNLLLPVVLDLTADEL